MTSRYQLRKQQILCKNKIHKGPIIDKKTGYTTTTYKSSTIPFSNCWEMTMKVTQVKRKD